MLMINGQRLASEEPIKDDILEEPYDGRLSRGVLGEAWAEMPLPTRLLLSYLFMRIC